MGTDGGERVELVDVTPDLAHEWLGYNTHNRRLRDRVVASYAADMKADDWRWNGEAIKFAEDGALLDGQHRLAAIIAADISVKMLVIRGLPTQAQETMDGGAKRKFSDVLNLRGEANYTTLAAIIRLVHSWEAGYRKSGAAPYSPTNAQMFQVIEKHPQLRDIARDAHETARGCGLPASIIGLCWWLFEQIDPEDAEFFFARLKDGQNIAKGDAIYELRRTIEASRTVRGQRSQTFLVAVMIKAWNAYRDGTTVGLLRYRPGGASPEKFPEPR